MTGVDVVTGADVWGIVGMVGMLTTYIALVTYWFKRRMK